MGKESLRKNTIKTLSNLSKEEKSVIGKQIQNNLFASKSWKNANTIGITISQEGIEWDTKEIIEKAWEEGKKVVVPKCIHTNRSMDFYEFRSYDELEIVYFNLKEPIPNEGRLIDKNDMDLLIVPGVVFDASGYRIGFGGGYYDRFLVDFHHTTMSLVSNVQLVPNVPKEKHDLPVNFLVTEEGII